MRTGGQKTLRSNTEKLVAMAKEDDSTFVRLYLSSALQRLPLDQRWGPRHRADFA